MKSDTDIKRDVESELQWDPSVDDQLIGVMVSDGVVTLTGDVCHVAGRLAAENITKRVSGVRAIANDIQVKIPPSGRCRDTDVALAVADALQRNVATKSADIKPVVVEGWVTLSGRVYWGFQRTAAEKAVKSLVGVKGVTNEISVACTIEMSDMKRKIKSAFRRNAIG
jgi:osmotically-inducible protein OsmY